MQLQTQTPTAARFASPDADWIDVCALSEIVPGTGVAVWAEGHQVAVFRTRGGDQVYAVTNFDPFSKAFVLSRGIVGDKGGVPKVASPMYKHTFDLRTGQCLDDPAVRIATFPACVMAGKVLVHLGGRG